jgi:hypothetical protein
MMTSLMKRSLILSLLPALSALSAPPAAPPKAPEVPKELPPQIQTLQPGVKLTLLAEHPDLVTPTGIDVDEQGNIYSISCHTHFRPAGYAGPAHDEVVVFNKDGKNRRVFYNKTDATMHVECGPDGWIYLAERDRILRVKDNARGLPAQRPQRHGLASRWRTRVLAWRKLWQGLDTHRP